MIGSIVVFVVALAIVLLALKLLGKSIKILWGVLVNAVVGFIILFVLRAFGVDIEINWLTSILVGLFGLPGIIFILILKYGLNANF